LKISEKVTLIVAKTFEIPVEKVLMSTSPSNTSSWDSFGQMALVLNVEKEFGVVLEFEEVFQIVDTQSIIDLITKKMTEA
jgi:acyl carrier protein